MAYKEYTEAVVEIHQNVHIEDAVAKYLKTKKKGVNYVASCPFHDEKTASFTISPAKGIYKCFGCGKAGDVVKFYREFKKLGYQDAIEAIANDFNILIKEREGQYNPEFAKKIKKHKDLLVYTSNIFHQDVDFVREYLTERRITAESIEKFQLGYSNPNSNLSRRLLQQGFSIDDLMSQGLIKLRDGAPAKSDNINDYYEFFRNRIMFPIFNENSVLQGFAGRRRKEDDHNKKLAKYVNSAENEFYKKGNFLYGLNVIWKDAIKAKEITLVEGYTDTIILQQEGILAVGKCGSAFTENSVKLVRRFAQRVDICGDGDNAGIKATKSDFEKLIEGGISTKAILMPNEEDPASFVANYSIEDFLNLPKLNLAQFYIKTSQSDPDSKLETLKNIVQELHYISDPIKKYLWIKEVAKELDIREIHVARKYTQDLENEIRNNNMVDYFSEKFINSLASLFVVKLLKSQPDYATGLIRDVPISKIPNDGTIFSPSVYEVYKKINEQFPSKNYQMSLFGTKMQTSALSLFPDEKQERLERLKQTYMLIPELKMTLVKDNDKFNLEQIAKLLRAEVFIKEQNSLLSKLAKESANGNNVEQLMAQIEKINNLL